MSVSEETDAGIPRAAHGGVRPLEETSLYGFMSVILRYRGMVAVLMTAFAAYGTLRVIEKKPVYTTRVGLTVDLRPEQTSQARALAGETGRAIAFFTELLESRPLLLRVAGQEYSAVTSKGTMRGPLPEFLGHSRDELHQDWMFDYLIRHVRVASSPRSGNIWIFIDAPYPEVAYQMGVYIVREVEEYSRTRRKAQAAAERQFVEERLAEARADLRAAEAQLLNFRISNRDLSAPALDMAHGRLQREVGMKQELYTSLLQALDRARIEEARDRPSVAVLEAPEIPARPEPSSALSVPILSAIAGLLVAIVVAFIRERMAETKAAQTPAFSQYMELRRQALKDLRNPMRPIRRAMSRSDG